MRNNVGKSISRTIVGDGHWKSRLFGPWNGNERSECRFIHGDIALLSEVLRKEVASLTVSCLVPSSILGPAPMKGQIHLWTTAILHFLVKSYANKVKTPTVSSKKKFCLMYENLKFWTKTTENPICKHHRCFNIPTFQSADILCNLGPVKTTLFVALLVGH